MKILGIQWKTVLLVVSLLIGTVRITGQTVDSFTDGDFTNNPTWTGDSDNFWVTTPHTNGDGGLAGTNDGNVLGSKPTTGSSALFVQTNRAYGQWSFSAADGRGWAVSSTNDFFIVLMSDTNNPAAFKGSLNFNGYYLRFDGGVSDNFILYRQQGTTKTALINTEFPAGDDGTISVPRSFKITRSNLGEWSVYIDNAWDITPTTLRGTATDNTITTGQYFGVVTNIGTLGIVRVLWFDNLYCGDIIYDTTPPIISAAMTTGPNTATITFSETVSNATALNTGNYVLQNIGNPVSAQFLVPENTTVRLQFSQNFPLSQPMQLQVSNVEDLAGNVMETSSITLLYAPPQPGDVVINEIFFDPSPTVGLPDFDFLELYNRRNYPVSITNWKLTIGTKLITLPTYTMAANSYLLLAPSAAYEIYSQYGTVLTLISTTDLTNTGREITLRDTANQLIHTVTYDVSFYQDPNKVDGGWSIEQIDPNGWCQQRANWRASVATIGGTPGSVNSVLASNIDVTAPQVMSVNVVTPSRIDILFNEQIHAQQAQNVLNYSITPSLTILSATMNTQMNGVVLALGQNLVLETEYSLTISNISDFCQNSMPTPHVATLIIRAIEPGDVVINEIFFDPSPTVGLPDYDFLELYNRRNYPVSITNWKLTIGTKLITLPTYTMAANSYLLLAPSAAYEIYSQYGTVLTLISTTDLTNTGREITLRDTANQLIHTVTYDVSFYQDPNKVDGGWSIEQIDPNGWCQQRANWRASVATIGGTPGSVNSVLASNIDVTAPQVMSVNVVTPSRIDILFNEQIHAQQAQNVLNYSITPSLTILSATMNTQMNGVVLALGQNLVLETEYSLTISNISDFCQNSMPTPHVATLIIRAIEPGDVVINEIFFDPSPTVGLPDYDFLELYNRRNYPVSITNWKLTIGTKLITLPTYTMAANSYLILAPSAAYEIYSQYGTVLTLISTTDLTNTGREITLRDTANQLIHTVTYDVSFYQDLNKVDGGWSIEQIDPNGWCQQRANWRASVATIGGTPGRVNSVLADNIDITPPSVQAVWAENVRRIKVVFNEVVSRTSVTNISNYQIDGGLTIGFIEYDSVAKNGITLILNNSISEGVEYVLTISNISDFCGNTLLSAQKTVVYSQPQFGTVVFNEIMCNPIENAGLPNIQYIELFNCSQYPISLFQWKLKSGSTVYTFPAVIIEPQSYLLIKSAGITDTIQTIVPEINLFSSTFLSRTSKNMELYSRNERLIHWISYSNTWYRDEYKKLGGFSLEQIDPTNFCSGGANWIASNAQTGGTPGAINSVNGSFPDNTAPEILYLTVDNDTCVTLHFNEPLRYAELLDNTKWSVEPAGMPANVIASVPTGNLISLVFNTPLLENTTYTVTLPTIFDCVGNEKQIEPKTFQLPDYPIENEIVINEILSNPFSGGTEFVELYNKTNRIFALNDLHVTRIGTSGNLDPLKKVSEFGHLLYPNDYLVLAKTRRQIAQFYPRVDSLKVVEVTSLPSIPNSAGSLLFMNTDGVVIDQFVYNEKMHTPLLRNVKGVSLERINPNGITQNVNNWQSAAETEGYATPTYKNSQYNENPASTSKFSLSSAIFSPDSDGYHDYLLIGYLFDQSGYSVNIKIFDSHGRLMKDLVQNHLAGIEGELKWDGTDRNNNRVQVGPYVIFIEYFDTSGNVNREKLVVTVAFRK
jgi:hypothetical protein